MNLKFLVKSVDMNGYCGREFHPHTSDEGLIVTPVKMETLFFSPETHEPVLGTDGRVLNEALPFLANADLDIEGESGLEVVWTCITADGRVLELMDHEVVVALPEDSNATTYFDEVRR